MTKRRKLALCVGINDYPGTGSDLAGCVNDAVDWGAALEARGYEVQHLLDSVATADKIRRALATTVAQARFGDRVVFTYSGHGTWVPDRDGDEPDRRDEALCAHDYAQGGLILDDELHGILSARRFGVRVTTISDSCHSGSMMRLAAPVPGLRQSKFLPPPGMAVDEALQVERRTAPRGVSRPTGVLVSGCADHEVSYDAVFGGRANGAMSYHLLRALDDEGGSSVRAVFDRLRLRLPSGQYPQSPQLTASTYQRRTALF